MTTPVDHSTRLELRGTSYTWQWMLSREGKERHGRHHA